MNFNRVIIGGHLTRDIELRYTPSGAAVAQFGVAVNHTWKTESGEQKQSVTFVDVTAWRQQAEVIAQYFRKGDPILVEGRLSQDAWVDKNTQQKHTKIKVVLEQFTFVKSKGKDDAPTDRIQRPDADAGQSSKVNPEVDSFGNDSDDAPPF